MANSRLADLTWNRVAWARKAININSQHNLSVSCYHAFKASSRSKEHFFFFALVFGSASFSELICHILKVKRSSVFVPSTLPPSVSFMLMHSSSLQRRAMPRLLLKKKRDCDSCEQKRSSSQGNILRGFAAVSEISQNVASFDAADATQTRGLRGLEEKIPKRSHLDLLFQPDLNKEIADWTEAPRHFV